MRSILQFTVVTICWLMLPKKQRQAFGDLMSADHCDIVEGMTS